MLKGANPLGVTGGWAKEESRFFNLLSFFASLPVSGPDWVLVFYRCVVVKAFDNFTVGDLVKYYLICAVSIPFLFYFT